MLDLANTANDIGSDWGLWPSPAVLKLALFLSAQVNVIGCCVILG